jgi:hypothetical protein
VDELKGKFTIWSWINVFCAGVWGFAWHDTFGSSARWSDYVTCSSSITISCMIQLGQALEPRKWLWRGKDKLNARGSPWSQWRCVTSQTALSNKPTAWSRDFLEKLTFSQLVQQFTSLYAFRHVICVFTRVSWHFILPTTSRSSKRSHSFRFPHQNP